MRNQIDEKLGFFSVKIFAEKTEKINFIHKIKKLNKNVKMLGYNLKYCNLTENY